MGIFLNRKLREEVWWCLNQCVCDMVRWLIQIQVNLVTRFWSKVRIIMYIGQDKMLLFSSDTNIQPSPNSSLVLLPCTPLATQKTTTRYPRVLSTHVKWTLSMESKTPQYFAMDTKSVLIMPEWCTWWRLKLVYRKDSVLFSLIEVCGYQKWRNSRLFKFYYRKIIFTLKSYPQS